MSEYYDLNWRAYIGPGKGLMAQHAYLTKKDFFHNRNYIFMAFFSALFKPLFLVDCQRYRFGIMCHESLMSDLDMIYYQTFSYLNAYSSYSHEKGCLPQLRFTR